MPRLNHFFLVLASAAFYTFLFSNEKPGINILIFSIFLILVMHWRWPAKYWSIEAKYTCLGTLLSGGMLVIWNSELALVAHVFSIVSWIAFVQRPEINALHLCAAQIVSNFRSAPKGVLYEFSQSEGAPVEPGRRLKRMVKLILLPVLFLWLFYAMYFNANPYFADLANRFWSKFDQLGGWLGNAISWYVVVFFFWAVVGMVGVFFVNRSAWMEKLAQKQVVRILRSRSKIFVPRWTMMALKWEYRMAILFLCLVNGLLAIVNATDMRWVWFGFDQLPEITLSQYVHEGTYLLIVSILMAMGLVIFIFRGNLNFFHLNAKLRWWANLWVVQNMVLVISVAIRNFHYVEYYALAYKRIGVFVFLILVGMGLFSLLLKINDKKTAFFLLRWNGWAAYTVILILSCCNWDPWIAHYNLLAKHKGGFDVEFCHDLSPKAIPIILQHLDAVEAEMNNPMGLAVYSRGCTDMICFKQSLRNASLKYLQDDQCHSWLSWNAMDKSTLEFLKAYYADQWKPNVTASSSYPID